MPRWSQASVVTISGSAFDIDLPGLAAAAVRIYFCGHPARSTGIVNLRLLLGDHGYVLAEKRRVKAVTADDGETAEDNDSNNDNAKKKQGKRSVADNDADSSSTTADGESGTNVHDEKKSSHSTYRLCSSEGLPPGCFRVKHDRHYWVMRAGDGVAPAQTPHPRPTEEQLLSLSAPPSAVSQTHVDAVRIDLKKKGEKEGPEESEKQPSRRKRSHHAKEVDEEERTSAKTARVDHRPHESAVEAAEATRRPADTAANVAAGAVGDVVGDVEATLAELFFSSASLAPSTKPSPSALPSKTAAAAGTGTAPHAVAGGVGEAPQKPAAVNKTKKGVTQTDAERSAEESAEATPPPLPRRRGRRGAVAVAQEENEAASAAADTSTRPLETRSSTVNSDVIGLAGEESASLTEKHQHKGKKNEKRTDEVAAPEEPPHRHQRQPEQPESTPLPRNSGKAVSPPSPYAAPMLSNTKQDASARRRRPVSPSPSPSPPLVDSPPPRLATPPPPPAAIPPVALPRNTTEQKKTRKPAHKALTSTVSPTQEVEAGEKQAVSSATPKTVAAAATAAASAWRSGRLETFADALRTPTPSPPTARSPALQSPLPPPVAPPTPPKSGLLSTAGQRHSADTTPQHGRHRSRPSGAKTTSPTFMYSNRSSGTVASRQEQLPLPSSSSTPAAAPATGIRSTSSSARLAPLTSPHLRQHQQQFSHRGSSSSVNNNGNHSGHGGSLQQSDGGSFYMIPQDSPALGFTQVHNTLAEEFSLDPSASDTSSTVSEYLYDVEG
ncbi:hypothetical protein ABB37_08591 [Leptomonas pyrrhocoris]|uniref:Uncharacterized protein n=1 Tax=Leptomonas pyrrhocoris TaxID=157538 RepID=A0A0M9FSP2_LEPPY|nr:hypothetical protein ABB37_08591 [Leptomonas pyrrhocoris]KPA75290.1 hypothetical protein ABB37_08591 [Leptomonas pyrrhocoris]|eukprot:XP_015653729.1 hypothetical protein ABB37_08591 [Leptomonas pyrrhocoris]